MTITPADIAVLKLCDAAKTESQDPDRQVGAVLVGADGRILATGTNTPPIAINFTPQDSARAIRENPDWRHYMLEHAERNAIGAARRKGEDLTGSTIYISLFPCADCARAIVAEGIARVVAPQIDTGTPGDERWQTHFKFSQWIFELAGVQIDQWSGL